ncbi:exo-alpha-sialidase [Trypanosoma cruzi]|nr:exo-alpha-sialidase [Trypanosoma cruzi]
MGLSNSKYMTLHLNETETKKQVISTASVRNILPVVKLFLFNPHQRNNCISYITLHSVCSTTAAAHHHDEEDQHRGSKHMPGHVGPLRLTLSSFPPPSAGSGHAATVVCAGCLHSSNT